MTRLRRLYTEQGQSPWLDNLTRDSLDDGSLQGLIQAGIRGVTANPSILNHAMAGSDKYTRQLRGLLRTNTQLSSLWQRTSPSTPASSHPEQSAPCELPR